MNVTVVREPLTEPDVSPAYKDLGLRIHVDSRLSIDEQLHGAFYEVLSAWLDPLEKEREKYCCIASDLLDAYRGIYVTGQE